MIKFFFSLHDYNHSHYDLDDCKNVYTAIERMLKSLNTQMLYQEERRENEVSQWQVEDLAQWLRVGGRDFMTVSARNQGRVFWSLTRRRRCGLEAPQGSNVISSLDSQTFRAQPAGVLTTTCRGFFFYGLFYEGFFFVLIRFKVCELFSVRWSYQEQCCIMCITDVNVAVVWPSYYSFWPVWMKSAGLCDMIGVLWAIYLGVATVLSDVGLFKFDFFFF